MVSSVVTVRSSRDPKNSRSTTKDQESRVSHLILRSSRWIPGASIKRDVVYYESTKRELNKRLIFECRCDARVKAKAEGSTRLAYRVFQSLFYFILL